MDINQNKPWTLNQVPQQRPAIPTASETLTGFIANSFNAGHNRTIHWKQVMAGEKHKECRVSMKVKLLTPLTPPYQNLYLTTRAYFVPNIRVWKNAEKYTAQRGGSAEIKIKEIPNTGGKIIPAIPDEGQNNYTNYCNTDFWRDSFISSYFPRMGQMTTVTGQGEQEASIELPKINILPLRGRLAIYNDWERNKEFDEVVQEWDGDQVTDNEWRAYLNPREYNTFERRTDQDYYTMRARRPNSYYSAFRTDLQGFETEYPPEDMSADRALITWASWESKIAEARSEPENTNANDWQIIARIRGSQIAEQGKVQLIGENTTTLNYAAVTQNAYNNSEQVENVNFKVLGQQGAYSYTEINIPVYAGFEAIEEGFIHIIATVWADSVFTTGIDRTLLNVTPLDQYRPDLKDDKNDVLYEIEAGTKNIKLMGNYYKPMGFKRKYNEYFKLPTVIAGDLTNDGYFKMDYEESVYTRELIEPQSTYQFFEDDRYYMQVPGAIVQKKPWKDYSDLLVNKNQAIMQTVVSEETITGDNDKIYSIYVQGQNQVDLVGKVYLDCILPIDGKIKNNVTDWGEH